MCRYIQASVHSICIGMAQIWTQTKSFQTLQFSAYEPFVALITGPNKTIKVTLQYSECSVLKSSYETDLAHLWYFLGNWIIHRRLCHRVHRVYQPFDYRYKDYDIMAIIILVFSWNFSIILQPTCHCWSLALRGWDSWDYNMIGGKNYVLHVL